jgi:hypothetical protein
VSTLFHYSIRFSADIATMLPALASGPRAFEPLGTGRYRDGRVFGAVITPDHHMQMTKKLELVALRRTGLILSSYKLDCRFEPNESCET